MTCFWIGLMHAIRPYHHFMSHIDIISHLKNNNIRTPSVRWNGISITEQQMEENHEHIREYNITTVNHGYLCSSCDPFLILLVELYKINIIHNYNSTIIKYEHNEPNGTINIFSDKGHLWA